MTTEQELEAKKARIEAVEARLTEVVARVPSENFQRLVALAEVLHKDMNAEPFSRLKECEFFYVASINGRTRTELHRCKTCYALTDDTEAHARFHFHHRCLHVMESGLSVLQHQRLQISIGYTNLAFEELLQKLERQLAEDLETEDPNA